jgi:hypothetical protein
MIHDSWERSQRMHDDKTDRWRFLSTSAAALPIISVSAAAGEAAEEFGTLSTAKFLARAYEGS